MQPYIAIYQILSLVICYVYWLSKQVGLPALGYLHLVTHSHICHSIVAQCLYTA